MSEYDTVRTAVETARATTPAARRLVYRELTDTLQRQIAATQPKFRRRLSERIQHLRQAISEFEYDIRAGSVREPSTTHNKTPPDPSISTVLVPAPRAPPLGRVRTIVALTLRFLRHLSRLGPAAAVWIVIEPLMQMGVIILLYSLVGASTIMDMEPIPFVVVGVAAWFMFRMATLRSALMPIEPGLVLIPRVRMIDIVISRAATYSILYTWALFFFLTLLGVLGVGAPVDDVFGVARAWVVVAALAVGVGLVLRGLVSMLPIATRFLPWFNRAMFYTSGVIFVSEQMPDQVAKYLLMSPIFNAIQIMRSEYFKSYETTEASLVYAAGWAVALIALGLTMQAGRLRRYK